MRSQVLLLAIVGFLALAYMISSQNPVSINQENQQNQGNFDKLNVTDINDLELSGQGFDDDYLVFQSDAHCEIGSSYKLGGICDTEKVFNINNIKRSLGSLMISNVMTSYSSKRQSSIKTVIQKSAQVKGSFWKLFSAKTEVSHKKETIQTSEYLETVNSVTQRNKIYRLTNQNELKIDSNKLALYKQNPIQFYQNNGLFFVDREYTGGECYLYMNFNSKSVSNYQQFNAQASYDFFYKGFSQTSAADYFRSIQNTQYEHESQIKITSIGAIYESLPNNMDNVDQEFTRCKNSLQTSEQIIAVGLNRWHKHVQIKDAYNNLSNDNKIIVQRIQNMTDVFFPQLARIQSFLQLEIQRIKTSIFYRALQNSLNTLKEELDMLQSISSPDNIAGLIEYYEKNYQKNFEELTYIRYSRMVGNCHVLFHTHSDNYEVRSGDYDDMNAEYERDTKRAKILIVGNQIVKEYFGHYAAIIDLISHAITGTYLHPNRQYINAAYYTLIEKPYYYAKAKVTSLQPAYSLNTQQNNQNYKDAQKAYADSTSGTKVLLLGTTILQKSGSLYNINEAITESSGYWPINSYYLVK